jgi:hypothetical protein
MARQDGIARRRRAAADRTLASKNAEPRYVLSHLLDTHACIALINGKSVGVRQSSKRQSPQVPP